MGQVEINNMIEYFYGQYEKLSSKSPQIFAVNYTKGFANNKAKATTSP
jgi:hypothetical protein